MMRQFTSMASIYQDPTSQQETRLTSNVVDLSRLIHLPEEKEMVVDDVTVIPGFMIFEDAFEGKEFVRKLTLRNNGRSSAAFRIATMERAVQVSPGLSIVRKIRYTHKVGNPELSTLPISINGKIVDYKLKVRLTAPQISVDPRLVDFGEFATWQSPELRTVTLRNTGARSATFAIDLGSNELDLLVEPMKGVVAAYSEVVLRVEMMGTKRGSFVQEFWIKCVTPVRVQVVVTFVVPTLLSYHPDLMTDFTMIDFPRTYFGTKIRKTMVLTNNSPVGVMYCSKSVINAEVMEIREAQKRGEDMSNFDVWPSEGRIAPHESKICEVVYTPVKTKKTKKGEKFDNYALSFIRVLKVNWKDMFNYTFQGTFHIDDRHKSMDAEATDSICTSLEGTNDNASRRQSLAAPDEFSFPSLSYIQSVTKIESVDVDNCLRVCLYGEGETANVLLRPDALHLGSIEMGRAEERELLVFNRSQVLPILFRYRKVAFVDVVPKQGTVQPTQGKEVLVTVTPRKCGKVKTKICFDLLYYDFPRKAEEYVVVGEDSVSLEFEVPFSTKTEKKKVVRRNCGDKVSLPLKEIRFTTKVHIPKCIMPPGGRNKYERDNAFIAFRNDRPASIRPWRKSDDIKTMFARIPRARCMTDEYTLTASQEQLKSCNKSYYQQFTKKEAERLRKLYCQMCSEPSDYSITNQKKLLWDNFKPLGNQSRKESALAKKAAFIPLTPSQLYNVSVIPLMIQLEGVVPDSDVNTAITVKNTNEFAIRVYLAPRKLRVMEFPEGNRKTVKANAEVEIAVRYKAENVGKHFVVMDVIINESHGCECVIQTRVINGFVTTDPRHIEFLSNGPSRCYVKLTNPCNKQVSFNWENMTKSLTIQPLNGTVPGRRFMYCKVSYTPVVSERLASEIILTSGFVNAKLMIDVFATVVKAKVALSTENLEVPRIPLNLLTRRRVTLRNLGCENVLFRVVNPKPLYGISVTPTEGLLRSFGDQIIYVSMQIPTCISFSCAVEIEIQQMSMIKFAISGKVEFPNVVVKPRALQLRKIFLGCFDVHKFQIENAGGCDASVSFNFESYPEFYVSELPEKDSPPLFPPELLLEPKEQRVLYLHFVPIDVAPNRFYLPIILNDVLGPPSKMGSDTIMSSTYLSPGLSKYFSDNAVVPVEYPEKLTCTEVNNAVSCGILEVSDLYLEFHTYTLVDFKAIKNLNFFVTNVAQDEIEFSISTDKLNGPFYLTHLEGGTVEEVEDFLVVRLGSSDEAIFNVKFATDTPGIYVTHVPMYVTDYLEEPFNYLILRGALHEPEAEIPHPTIYMLPVSVGVRCESHFLATLRYHVRDCVFTPKRVSQQFQISTYRENADYLDPGEEGLHISVYHISTRAEEYSELITLQCTCGSTSSFTVKGSSENCGLTTHVFRDVYCAREPAFSEISATDSLMIQGSEPSVESESFSCVFPASDQNTQGVDCTACPFPSFPKETDSSYFKYMIRCLQIMEMWIHKLCFYGKQYYKVPEDIAAFPAVIEANENRKEKPPGAKKDPEEVLIYLLVLRSLAGSGVVKNIKAQGGYPADNAGRVAGMYTAYQNSIQLLKSQQAFLQHVHPKHLLDYDDYKIYTKHLNPAENAAEMLLDETTFLRRSTQSWLDLILQTCKVFVLFRVVLPRRASRTSVESKEEMGSHDVQTMLERVTIEWDVISRMIENDKDTNSAIYSTAELTLLAWMRYVFRTYHRLLYVDESLPDKALTSFREDLWDGIVFAVLTAVYCPYLYKKLREMFVVPKSYEEALHNASVLILAWENVKISFHLSPTDLVFPCEIQMIMLSAYLYEILPTLHPSETIVLEAPLSLKSTKRIPVRNSNDAVVVYRILFFDNDKKYFSADVESLSIGPKKTGSVTITYHAKKINKVRCVLLLSGETTGWPYAKSVAYYLEGTPDITYYDESNDIVYNPNLYEQLQQTLTIRSPYKEAATYNIYFHYGPPTDASKIASYKEMKLLMFPRIVYNPDNHINCDANGVATTYPTLCTMSSVNADLYIYFVNDEVGDFCSRLKINPNTKLQNLYEEIKVTLQRGFLDLPCHCTDKKSLNMTCPKTLFIYLPCKNNIMWSCVEKMFMESLEESQYQFWKRYLGTSTGSHLLRSIMQTNRELIPPFILHLLNVTVEYDVSLESANGEITLAPDVIIDDIHSLDKTEFPVHINGSGVPKSFFFTLISKDGLEYRYYKVDFAKK